MVTDNTTKTAINRVYRELADREIHPSGSCDRQGRWYADNSHLINVRSPSNSWPYSEMVACRTKKYVTAVAEYYGVKTYRGIIRHI